MSAIAGLLRFDNQNVSRYDLERAANAIGQYGPDRSRIVASENIGLVCALMRMTPEDQFDRQPQRGASGALIAADVRLDNRDDVLTRIGVAPHEAMAWADSRVLLAAWEKLGDNIWSMLRGPFAVAIWDARRRVLTLARDHLGLNVVMWHKNHKFFAFATMPNGLFAFTDVPRELSEEKFADFLVLNHADHATTIYRNIFRALPAHVLKVHADGSIQQRRYWSPMEINRVKLPSDAAYADGLRACLDLAVRRQTRSAYPIGCLLSGGLDSSSVAVLAARALGEKNLRLIAFTGVPRRGFDGEVPTGHYADETPYVETIKNYAGNIDIIYARNDTYDDFAELDRFFVALQGPVRNPTNFGWMLALLRAAHAQGRRVLLGGFRGNHTISWNGWSQSATHLKRARFLTAYRQWRLFHRCTPYSRWVALRKLIIEPLLPECIGNFIDHLRHPQRIAAWQDHAAIRVDFANAMSVNRRARQVGHDFLYRMRGGERIHGLTNVDYFGDWYAAEKAITGVEVRDPTADLDLISYCLGVPPEQYLAEGIDRSLIRRAMWGLLPETVLTNRMSGLQAADWYEKLESQRDQLARQLTDLSESPLARRIIDFARLERAINHWPNGGWYRRDIFQEYCLALTRGLTAGKFLRWFESTNRSNSRIS